jgi:hypothetical protein
MTKKFYLTILLTIILFMSSCSSKSNRYEIETYEVTTNNQILDTFKEMLTENQHTTGINIPYSQFTFRISGNSTMYHLDYLGYNLFSGRYTNDGKPIYDGYNCEREVTFLNCYTVKDDSIIREEIIDTIPYLTFANIFLEHEISSIIDEIIIQYGPMNVNNITLSVRIDRFDNENVDPNVEEFIVIDDDTVHTDESVYLNGLYLVYLIGEDTQEGYYFRFAYVKMD